MKPNFPPIPTNNDWIRAIDPAWFRQLRDFCLWSSEHPRGDGNSIINSSEGILRTKSQTSSADGVEIRLFNISLEGDKLKITKGFYNINGVKLGVTPDESFIAAIETGYICLHAEITDVEILGPIFIIVDEITANDYPLGFIDETGAITQYCVTVAMFMISKVCQMSVLALGDK